MEGNKDQSQSIICKHWCCCCSGGGRVGLGVVLLLIGGYYIAQDLGWITFDVSFWSIILVAFGIYFIFGKAKNK